MSKKQYRRSSVWSRVMSYAGNSWGNDTAMSWHACGYCIAALYLDICLVRLGFSGSSRMIDTSDVEPNLQIPNVKKQNRIQQRQDLGGKADSRETYSVQVSIQSDGYADTIDGVEPLIFSSGSSISVSLLSTSNLLPSWLTNASILCKYKPPTTCIWIRLTPLRYTSQQASNTPCEIDNI